ncbi:transmembrane protein, putative [Medicago truncatula]|uniref:Transmembrane protein, putative n=1 Tax=Medicago truncatula TaxID=3880 RepID=A0A072U5B4_MEDTR|nr:transmembrane protein, putative [Medicago truncatula]
MIKKREKRESVCESSVEAMSSPPILPPDPIMQILLWLPVKLLIIFTSVFKRRKITHPRPKFRKTPPSKISQKHTDHTHRTRSPV